MTEPIDQATKEEQPYFYLSKNEHGKMWLMYKPEGNGRYKCWEPITGEFWQEFEKLQSATVWAEKIQDEIKQLMDDLRWCVSELQPFENMEAMGPLESMKLREIIKRHKL